MFMISLISTFVLAASVATYPNSISAEQAYGLVSSDEAILIDVRERHEIASGMAEPAIWYANSEIQADFSSFNQTLTTEASGKIIIIYCRSGRRASRVVAQLRQLGWDARNMGGFADWLNAGFQVRTP